jgi:hypothetical protein
VRLVVQVCGHGRMVLTVPVGGAMHGHGVGEASQCVGEQEDRCCTGRIRTLAGQICGEVGCGAQPAAPGAEDVDDTATRGSRIVARSDGSAPAALPPLHAFRHHRSG